ncbi:hypothetical protein PIB30_085205 [Stylosanthes scabra]|uniref:Uncharacterized protein n=1 Tax=Stylosanthes scabra TaxID=79078 RepID=A0ABU6QSW2_9FABA|nr:hypothetical protein [Stylosanthes scabra]
MAQGTTPTNGGSSSIPTTCTIQQSSKRTRATMFSALNNVLPIQPRRLFHSDVTHGTTISINRREHVKGGDVLPLGNHNNLDYDSEPERTLFRRRRETRRERQAALEQQFNMVANNNDIPIHEA